VEYLRFGPEEQLEENDPKDPGVDLVGELLKLRVVKLWCNAE
jgi:hypothetical protein